MDADSTPLKITPVRRRNPWLNVKLLVAAGVVVAAVGFLVVNAMGSSLAYFHTVSELEESGRGLDGELVRVGGDVLAGSIQREALSSELRFTLTDGQGTLPVVYSGVIPDIFSEEVEVVAEGTIGPDGTLVANKLLTKCPSRFEADRPSG
ncbi:MAG TPA: cytochrome c maturation protein CcmE [Thermomicrobiales bacterium]|nr:cytochrome c maturation protein CcmE [Thermomicrobiales bacterium]